MDKHDYDFIREILNAIVKSNYLGFNDSELSYMNGSIKFTASIVNDIEMIEVKIFDRSGEILFWRAVPVEQLMYQYELWVREA